MEAPTYPARRRAETALLAFLVISWAPVASSAGSRATPPGILLESVAKGGAGERAGLRPGDLLRSWSRPPAPPANPEGASGLLLSPFDLETLEISQAPRGAVRIEAERGGQSITVTLGPGDWKMQAGFPMPPAARRLYTQGGREIEAGAMEEGLTCWRSLAADAEKRDETLLAAWLRLRRAQILAESGRRDESASEFDLASAQARQAEDSRAQVSIAQARSQALLDRQDVQGAREALRLALEILRRAPHDTLSEAHLLYLQGRVEWRGREILAARDLYQGALSICEREAPGSMAVSRALFGLGNVALARGEFSLSRSFYERDLEICHRLLPGGREEANTLGNLGSVARYLESILKHKQSARLPPPPRSGATPGS